MSPQFKDDSDLQFHFVAYLVRDTQFLALARPFIEPNHFTNEILHAVVRVALSFYDKYREAPDQLILQHVADMASEGLIAVKLSEVIQELCRDLLAAKLQNRQYLIEQHRRLLQSIAYGPALQDAAELAKHGKFDEVLERIRQATIPSHTVLGMFQPYTADPTARIERRKKRETERLCTGIPELDTRRAYIARGELGIIQGARTGIGKSALVVNLCRNYSFQDKRSWVCTLELSKDKYEDRLDMCFAGLPDTDLWRADEIAEKIRYRMKTDNMIHVSKFAAGSTVRELRTHSQLLRDLFGFEPDILFVDYDDLLDCGDKHLRTNMHLADKQIYEELREWAVDDNVAMWVVAQSTKEAGDGDKAGLSQMSGSACKARIADLVMSINRSDEEEVQGRTRIYVSKLRNAPGGFTVTIPTDLERMQFYCPQPAQAAA